MEEVLDSAFIADKSKAFVDQKSSDRPAWHTVSSGVTPLGNIPKVSKLSGKGRQEDAAQVLGERRQTTSNPPSSGARTVVAAHAELETAQV
jgi:hypothetical protein